VVVTASAAEADRLRANHPKCVALDISTFGSEGPLSHWKGPEIVVQALSGMMSNNGTAGQQPLFGVGNRAAYAAGVAGFISVLGALYARGVGAGGQRCSVDTAETAAAMAFPYVLQYEYNGTDRRRGDQEIPAGQVLCRGTWVCIWVYPFRFAAMCRTLGLDACIDDPRFVDAEVRSQNWDALFDVIQDKIADRDAEEVVRELQAAQVIAACAYRPGELRENPHLEARDYWGFTEAETGHRRYLGPPFRLSRTPRGKLAAITRTLPEEVTA
jgi:crotonobetainyl-CoA:carnitine CoA-transferase CaiB-like acyl-CoA transferase